ncbi:hypothetical protein [Spiroplasma endosymbiont of Polydrusus pterygomalis]|uniref:hypothetical protein n=1 Tax=Spiroplasma endosymbiont of Polydrusus pterygomalis TaxID=3139327 RepID=UPI003CCAB391
MTKEEKTPLLTNDRNANYGVTEQQPAINTNNYGNIIVNIENEWIKCTSRYGGETSKKKDENNNWQYQTKIINNGGNSTSINEKLIKIDSNQYWEKVTTLVNNPEVIELLKINFTNKKLEIYQKEYTNDNDYERNTLNLETFHKKERNLSPEKKFLEAITIKAIKGIDDLIINTDLLNEEIKLFQEKQTNSNLNTLLNIYKYLTVIQNFIDDSKPIATSKFKNILQKVGNLTLGALEIYIGLTGKNLQRVISNYPIDGKEHTIEDYINAIFLNPANYIMVLIDTALGTFCTSAASSWARDVFFNKETDPYQITKFNSQWLEQYQENLQLLLYEENHQQLIKYFSNISAINNLIQQFNEATNCDVSEFQYHPQFTEEIKQIKAIIATREANIDSNSEIKQLVSVTNKSIKTLKTEFKKPLTLTENWGYNLFINLVLETLTWAGSHIILTGSSENTAKENFNLQDWITKDIFSEGAFVANISRYFVMRPINNIFKSGLTKLGIPTNITPKKLARWIEKQPRYKKLLMAIPLFLIVTFIVNTVKTEAALVTEYGFEKAIELFYEKFFRWTTLGFSIGVTASDMITFAISDFYKNVFNQQKEFEILVSKSALAKLVKNGKLATFDEEFAKHEEQKLEDSGIATLSQRTKSDNSAKEETGSDTTIEDSLNDHYFDRDTINQQPQPSTSNYQFNSQFNNV